METSTLNSRATAAMEQLWYTWTSVGLERPGFQIHAASPGLGDVESDRLKALRRFYTYHLPRTANGLTLRPEDAPTCLALLSAGGERVLVHRSYAGRDGAGRPGNFFTHLVAGLPKGFTAGDAIRTWDSMFWQRGGSGLRLAGDLGLERVATIPPGPPSQVDISQPRVREHVAYVIGAFLELAPEGTLYIAAPPSVVAALIFALTRALPFGMLRHLTFSTYERDVLEAPARIVGSCLQIPATVETPPPEDLPEICYSGGNAALNWYTGRRTTLAPGTPAARYAEFIGAELLSLPADMPPEFVAFAQRLDITDAEALLGTHRLFHSSRSGPFTPDLLDELLADARRGRAFLSLQNVRVALVQVALGDRDWWRGKGQPMIQQLATASRRPGMEDLGLALSHLSEHAVSEAAEHFCRGARNDARFLIEKISLPAKPTEKVSNLAAFFREVSRRMRFLPEDTYDWHTRRDLLRYVAPAETEIPLREVRPWLMVDPCDGRDLLKLGLPNAWAEAAAKEIVLSVARDISPSAAVAELVVSHETLFNGAIERLLAEGHTDEVRSFCSGLIQSGYMGTRRIALLIAIARSPHVNATFLEDMISDAVLQESDIIALVNACAPSLLNKLAGRDSLSQLVSEYVEALPIVRLHNEATRELLALLGRSTAFDLAYQQRKKLEALSVVAEFYASLTDGFRDPGPVRRALDVLQPPGTQAGALDRHREQVNRLLMTRLADQVHRVEELERIILVLGPPLMGPRKHLFLGALIDSRRRPDAVANPAFLLACVKHILIVRHEVGREYTDSIVQRCEAVADKEMRRQIKEMVKLADRSTPQISPVAGVQPVDYSFRNGPDVTFDDPSVREANNGVGWAWRAILDLLKVKLLHVRLRGRQEKQPGDD